MKKWPLLHARTGEKANISLAITVLHRTELRISTHPLLRALLRAVEIPYKSTSTDPFRRESLTVQIKTYGLLFAAKSKSFTTLTDSERRNGELGLQCWGCRECRGRSSKIKSLRSGVVLVHKELRECCESPSSNSRRNCSCDSLYASHRTTAYFKRGANMSIARRFPPLAGCFLLLYLYIVSRSACIQRCKGSSCNGSCLHAMLHMTCRNTRL